MHGQIDQDKALAKRPSPLPDDHHHDGDDDNDSDCGDGQINRDKAMSPT